MEVSVTYYARLLGKEETRTPHSRKKKNLASPNKGIIDV
jgi:hypothetical protein